MNRDLWETSHELAEDPVEPTLPQPSTKAPLKSRSLPIETRQDILGKLSRRFHAEPKDLLGFDEQAAARVKASYAYMHRRADRHWVCSPLARVFET